MFKKIIKRILGKNKTEFEVLKKVDEGVTAFEQDEEEQLLMPIQKPNLGEEDAVGED